ncbi:hypothetical protein [Enterobacter sichuanensis]|uniref:hypothetical protein n=1 Tax=Enterobacter sichuanensis TaxID=2071710 RepID=UPI001EE489B6|nr:hypothetical protein [Enterobacter sichuanensis]
MAELTKEWLLKTIAELEEERDAVTGVVNEDAAMALAAMKLALASLEAEKGAEPVAKVETVGVCWYADNGVPRKPAVGTELFAAPPAPVAMKDHQIRDLVNELRDIAVEYYGTQQLRERIAKTVRAAMLHGAEPVTTAYKLPFEQWLSQQTGTIDVECGCVMTEVFFHWLRIAYEAGNSPVIPDGLVAVPVEPTIAILDEFDSIIDYGAEDSKDAWSRLLAAAWIKSLPAAPQQEA